VIRYPTPASMAGSRRKCVIWDTIQPGLRSGRMSVQIAHIGKVNEAGFDRFYPRYTASFAFLMKINIGPKEVPDYFSMEWRAIAIAPFDRDLELAVIDVQGRIHTLVFPCRRDLRGWIKSGTNKPVHVDPTHWREWDDSVSPFRQRKISAGWPHPRT
jgi:hypothetical protein